jgi:predicted nucleotidyltransferase
MIAMETPRTSRPSPDEARATIRLVAKRIAEAVDPVRVILFGSYARGDFTRMSDVDVCVILDDAGDWFERQSSFRRLVDIPGIDVEPHIYTRDEFEDMLAGENPLALRIRAEGRVLYEQH